MTLNHTDLSVKEFYDNNCKDFDVTRVRIWKSVKEFVKNITEKQFVNENNRLNVLDAGCGNGKNMIFMNNNHINTTGIDFSINLVNLCQDKLLNVYESDVRSIPFRDNSFDHVISIAVIHHLSSEEHRKTAINEMLRVCKPGGKVLISIWAFEQDEDSTFKFTVGDNYVKWRDTTRYYHIYDKDGAENLIKSYNVKNFYNELGNWFFLLEK